MNILVTGASGLLGKEILPLLLQTDINVYALDIRPPKQSLPNIKYIQGNLFDEDFITTIFNEIKPYYLVNLAWKVSGDYANSPLNFDFLKAGMNLLKAFKTNGGKRAVYFGSMFEYAASDFPLKEDSPLQATNAYEECKISLYKEASSYCADNGIELLWIRPFQIFGKDEVLPRLTAQIIKSIKENLVLKVKHSHLQRDFIFASDCAKAAVKLLFSSCSGPINLCAAKAVSLGDYARCFFNFAGKSALLQLENVPAEQPDLFLGDNSKLIKAGFKSFTPLENAVKIILQSNNIPYTDN